MPDIPAARPFDNTDVEMVGDTLHDFLTASLGLPPEMVRPYGAGEAVLARLVASGRWLRLDPDEPHLIEFRPDGWTIQHPLRCRPNLFACEVNRVGESLDGPSGPPPEGLGVYECWLDDGDFVIGGRRDG